MCQAETFCGAQIFINYVQTLGLAAAMQTNWTDEVSAALRITGACASGNAWRDDIAATLYSYCVLQWSARPMGYAAICRVVLRYEHNNTIFPIGNCPCFIGGQLCRNVDITGQTLSPGFNYMRRREKCTTGISKTM